MIPIFIDASVLADHFSLSNEEIDELVDFTVKEITASFAEHWANTASLHLGASRDIYVASLIVLDEGPGKGAVELSDKLSFLPNAIEQGLAPFDMKEILLSGPNAKTVDGVRYNTVPFQFAAPGSLGESEIFSGVLPHEVSQAINRKPQNIPVAGGGLKTSPLKVSELPSKHQAPVIKKTPVIKSVKFDDYRRKTSIFQGISKVKDPKTGQNTYKSFRRVSDNSAPESWLHPGIQEQNFADMALNDFDIESRASRAIDDFLDQKGL